MANEIATQGAGNALMITQQYPAERYNRWRKSPTFTSLL